ncbi:MAG: glycoside hydrolase family 25 protein [Lachnospiraceae bacterium]|nr:glycoside hydrolase family 25 protein [Lachnospiraceae bacterium]
MADNRNKRRKGNSLAVALMMTVFFFGLVGGMLLIHFTEVKNLKDQLKGAKDTANPTINIGEDVVNVYVPKREVRYGTIPIHSYNKDNFRLENGYMAYYDEEGKKISHLGVDLSYHQVQVDWNQLKTSPCEFVMLRCGYRGYTEGGLVEDEKFQEYATGATEAGFPLGVYFFTQALTEEEAIAEADFVLDLIEPYPISYPVVIDSEYVSDESARTNQAEMEPEERTKLLITFCERIKEAGYYPMVYASENWLRRELDVSMLQPYEIWAPQYLETNDFLYDFTIWQYTAEGQIPGVTGLCDLNISMVDYASFVPQLRQAYLGPGEIIEEGENPEEPSGEEGQ